MNKSFNCDVLFIGVKKQNLVNCAHNNIAMPILLAKNTFRADG